MTTPRFTAWCDCPKCERLDCHWLRGPRSAPTQDELVAYWVGVVNWRYVASMMGAFGLAPDGDEPQLLDESKFEVIRTCTGCGHEWGQM